MIVLEINTNYQEVKFKLTKLQLNKLKSATKNKAGATKKNLQRKTFNLKNCLLVVIDNKT